MRYTRNVQEEGMQSHKERGLQITSGEEMDAVKVGLFD